MEPLNDDWFEIFETNVDAVEKHHRDQRTVEDLEPMLRDAVALRMLDEYNGAMWDPTNYPAEARGTWPREYADEVPR